MARYCAQVNSSKMHIYCYDYTCCTWCCTLPPLCDHQYYFGGNSLYDRAIEERKVGCNGIVQGVMPRAGSMPWTRLPLRCETGYYSKKITVVQQPPPTLRFRLAFKEKELIFSARSVILPYLSAEVLHGMFRGLCGPGSSGCQGVFGGNGIKSALPWRDVLEVLKVDGMN